MSKPEISFQPTAIDVVFQDGVRGYIEREDQDIFFRADEAYYSADELRAIADQMDKMEIF